MCVLDGWMCVSACVRHWTLCWLFISTWLSPQKAGCCAFITAVYWCWTEPEQHLWVLFEQPFSSETVGLCLTVCVKYIQLSLWWSLEAVLTSSSSKWWSSVGRSCRHEWISQSIPVYVRGLEFQPAELSFLRINRCCTVNEGFLQNKVLVWRASCKPPKLRNSRDFIRCHERSFDVVL